MVRAVLERTKQLNRLFEDQVKKQYDAMRREVSKLAKAHQKDVQVRRLLSALSTSLATARTAQPSSERASSSLAVPPPR